MCYNARHGRYKQHKRKNEKNNIHQFGSKSKISFLYLSEIYSTHVVILFLADLVWNKHILTKKISKRKEEILFQTINFYDVLR